MTNSLRRISNNEVNRIFECVYNNEVPSEDISFQIVVVGEGSKLSPPSHEFDCGLYILLKPLKVKKNKFGKSEKLPTNDPRVPSNLKHLVFNNNFTDGYCKWQLSGPQFPRPSTLQQRYCYPKDGDPEYCNNKGASLWTVYKDNGLDEDEAYRLLHVYFSSKRAGGCKTPKRQTRREPIFYSPSRSSYPKTLTNVSMDESKPSSSEYLDTIPMPTLEYLDNDPGLQVDANIKSDNFSWDETLASTEGDSGAHDIENRHIGEATHLNNPAAHRILSLRHGAKCPHEDGKCPVTPHCSGMKRLWKHVAACKNKRCQVIHCVSSRKALLHYSRCKDVRCLVCGPVREIKHRYARQKQEELNKLREHNQEYKDNGLGEELPDVLTAVSVDEPRPSRSEHLDTIPMPTLVCLDNDPGLQVDASLKFDNFSWDDSTLKHASIDGNNGAHNFEYRYIDEVARLPCENSSKIPLVPTILPIPGQSMNGVGTRRDGEYNDVGDATESASVSHHSSKSPHYYHPPCYHAYGPLPYHSPVLHHQCDPSYPTMNTIKKGRYNKSMKAQWRRRPDSPYPIQKEMKHLDQQIDDDLPSSLNSFRDNLLGKMTASPGHSREDISKTITDWASRLLEDFSDEKKDTNSTHSSTGCPHKHMEV